MSEPRRISIAKDASVMDGGKMVRRKSISEIREQADRIERRLAAQAYLGLRDGMTNSNRLRAVRMAEQRYINNILGSRQYQRAMDKVYGQNALPNQEDRDRAFSQAVNRRYLSSVYARKNNRK